MDLSIRQSRITELERMLIDKTSQAEARLDTLIELMNESADREVKLTRQLIALSEAQKQLLQHVDRLEKSLTKLSDLWMR